MSNYNTFTNLQSSPALRNQSPVVTVYPSQAATYFGGMVQTVEFDTHAAKRMRASVGSSGKIGYIQQVDVYGTTFRVKPITPDLSFDSNSTPGILQAGEIITIFNVGT